MKRRAEKERATAAKEEEEPDAAAVDGEAGVVEIYGEENVDENKRKRRKSEVIGGSGRLGWGGCCDAKRTSFFKHVQGMVTIRAQEGVETEADDCCQGCY